MSHAKNKRYEAIKRMSNRMNERNDCTVKALAMTGRVTYKVAHGVCADYGRPERRGMYLSQQVKTVFNSIGFDAIKIHRQAQKNGSKFTPKTVGSVCKAGYYLAFTRSHVLPVINGEVYDWTDGRKHHITSIWKITRKRA